MIPRRYLALIALLSLVLPSGCCCWRARCCQQNSCCNSCCRPCFDDAHGYPYTPPIPVK